MPMRVSVIPDIIGVSWHHLCNVSKHRCVPLIMCVCIYVPYGQFPNWKRTPTPNNGTHFTPPTIKKIAVKIFTNAIFFVGPCIVSVLVSIFFVGLKPNRFGFSVHIFRRTKTETVREAFRSRVYGKNPQFVASFTSECTHDLPTRHVCMYMCMCVCIMCVCVYVYMCHVCMYVCVQVSRG